MKPGRKRSVEVMFAFAALMLLALGWYFWPNHEPKYQGKPVSFWFRQYYLVSEGNASNYTQDQLDDVLHKLGTNALPYLVKQALSTSRDTAFRTNFYEWLGKLPESWHLPAFVSYDDIRSQAVYAIGEIKPSGAIILPYVKRALEGTNSSQQRLAMPILVYVEQGKEALVPSFTQALHYSDPELRSFAISWLSELGPPAKAAVPDLIAILKDNRDTNGLDLEAALALGSIGPDAVAAVPLLKEMFDRRDSQDERLKIASALCQIDAQQSQALYYIMEGLKFPYPQAYAPSVQTLTLPFILDGSPPKNYYAGSAFAAAHYLGRIGPNAKAAVPALIALLDTTNTPVTIAAAEALHSIGAPNSSFVPKLEERLKIGDELDRLWIARSVLWHIDASNHTAVSVWSEIIKSGSTNALIAVQALRQSTPIAETGPLLREATNSPDPAVRNEAVAALKKIEAANPPK